MEMAPAGRLHALERTQEIRASRNGRGREVAVAHETPFAIEIAEKRFEELRALLDARRDLSPLAFPDEQRQVAQRPGALARLAIDAVGNAHVADVPVRGGETARDLRRIELGERLQEMQPMRARLAVPSKEFIMHARQARIACRPAGEASLGTAATAR
jgi:hypothetical protein